MRDGSGVRGNVVIACNVPNRATHHTIAACGSVPRGDALAAALALAAAPAVREPIGHAPAGSGVS